MGCSIRNSLYIAPTPLSAGGSSKIASEGQKRVRNGHPNTLPKVVVALRQTLAQQGKDCGAAAIQQALAQPGIEPVLAQRTIYRILHRYAKEVI